MAPTRSADADPFSDGNAMKTAPADSRASVDSPRQRVGRAQTAVQSQNKPAAAPTAKRSHSQDSALVADKSKSSKGRKKGSQHADVIDRLDFTGVGPMFHHDGPFDACAPSRNRHHNRAPMMAWSGRPDEAPKEYNDNPYPSPNAYSAFSGSYATESPNRKKVDAIAEAWGIHEPEPYEEFFAGGASREGGTPASSIYNGKETNGKDATARKRSSHQSRSAGHTNVTGNGSGASRSRNPARRSVIPPPQPIFAADSGDTVDPALSPGFAPGSPGSAPKRSKSLMHRIRKMRDSPNVPVNSDYEGAPGSPTSAGPGRPTHRPQNSFLGKFAKDGTRIKDTSVSPTTEKPEPYVLVEPHSPNKKELPATPGQDSDETPPESHSNGYFDGANGSSGAITPGGGIGRKTSIMKKVGRVVRGTR